MGNTAKIRHRRRRRRERARHAAVVFLASFKQVGEMLVMRVDGPRRLTRDEVMAAYAPELVRG